MRFQFVFLVVFSTCLCAQQVTDEKIPQNQTIKELPGSLKFRNVGPSRGGRVTAVAGSENQKGVFYMGATGGGVWKTNNYGQSWKNISDGYFSTPSIGAIAVYQKKPQIIYVGTGSDGIRSNVIVGKGVYKSVDEGKSWEFIGLKNAGQIGSVIIHPDNPEIVYIGAIGQPFRKNEERGVYKTSNGGKSWEKVFFLSDSVGCADLEFAPDNPDIIYATMWRAERKPWTIISGGANDGIYRSSDGGGTWKKLENGLPSHLIGKADLAVSKDRPGRVWAQIQASHNEEGIYCSNDFGDSWEKIDMPEKTHKSVMYRPFYFTNLSVNPRNADNIWCGTKKFWTSYDAGKTWKPVLTTHSDHQDLWINFRDSLEIIEGNDGGASVSRDGGKTWSTVFNQPTAELYSCNIDDRYPYYIYSGQQDNTTICVPGKPTRLDPFRANDLHNLTRVSDWENVGGCETGPAIAKPGSPDIVYANCKGQFSVYNRTTGKEELYYVGYESLYGNHPDDVSYRFQRVTPMEVSPHNPDIVYYGSQYVHKTVNGGKTWEVISPDLTANKKEFRERSGKPIDEDISGEENYATLYAIQESPVKSGVIWTGSNDGLVHVTKDNGESWTDITPKMPEGGRVSQIEASSHNQAKAYFAIYRDYLGDDRPYLFKTNNYGKTMIDISDGIPDDFPVRVLREDPKRKGLLYAGTEFGLFISFDDGENWSPFQLNLPVTPITDIRITRNDLVLSTLGRSFWVLDDISCLRHYEQKNRHHFQFFQPKDIIDYGQNFYFTLPNEKTDSVIMLEVIKGEEKIFSKRYLVNKLPENEWGIFKITWDLRHQLLKGLRDVKAPSVSPGTYQAVLNYSGKSVRQDFNFMLHPNLGNAGTSEKDLLEQEELALATLKLLQRIYSGIEQLKSAIATCEDQVKLKDLNARLDLLRKGPRRYDKPMLYDHTLYLYKSITSSPQKLGDDAFKRYKALKEACNKLLKD